MMRNVYYFLKKYIKKDIIKLSSGPRYVVGAKPKLDRSKLVIGCRVAVDQETYTLVRILPREVDPMVFNMLTEDPGKVGFEEIGGLNDQIRVLREVKRKYLYISYFTKRQQNCHLQIQNYF